MKKLLTTCLAFVLIANSSYAGCCTRVATVIHIQNRGVQCQSSFNSNLIGNMIAGAMFGKIMTGNDRGAFAGALIGTTINNGNNANICQNLQTVYWRNNSFGRSYQGSFNTLKHHHIGQRIYVDGLP